MITALKFWWSIRAWPWLKKNWQWVLLPIGLLLVVLRVLARKPVAPLPQSIGAGEVQLKETEKYVERVEQAREDRDAQLDLIDDAHVEAVEDAVEVKEKRVEELRGDPQKTTDFLKGVGQAQRRGKP